MLVSDALKAFGKTLRLDRHSARYEDVWSGFIVVPRVGGVLALALASLIPTPGEAYTAAGDRTFATTLSLPEPGPSDSVYLFSPTQPTAGENGGTSWQTEFVGTYTKMITERLGILFNDGVTRLDRVWGAENFNLTFQYEAINSQPHEFVLSTRLNQEFGGTGGGKVESLPQSATTPGLSFGKGLGDLPIGYLRPLAITGFAGYQFGYGARSDVVQAGISVQYSMPYLLSKVANIDLPPFIRGMTPLTEVFYNTPVGGRGQPTTLLIAPGINFNQGSGWEVTVEALIPATKATGIGVGFIAGLTLQLDYLFSDSVLGRPIFLPQ